MSAATTTAKSSGRCAAAMATILACSGGRSRLPAGISAPEAGAATPYQSGTVPTTAKRAKITAASGSSPYDSACMAQPHS